MTVQKWKLERKRERERAREKINNDNEMEIIRSLNTHLSMFQVQFLRTFIASLQIAVCDAASFRILQSMRAYLSI